MHDMVQEYLKSDQVAIRNANLHKFDNAIKVFVKCPQSPVTKDDVPKDDTPEDDAPKDKVTSWESTRTEYNNARQEYLDRKNNLKVKTR